MTAGTLCHLLQPGDRCGGDRQPQRDDRVPSPAQNTALLGNRLPEMGTAGGKWAASQAAGGSRGPELGASVQTQ